MFSNRLRFVPVVLAALFLFTACGDDVEDAATEAAQRRSGPQDPCQGQCAEDDVPVEFTELQCEAMCRSMDSSCQLDEPDTEINECVSMCRQGAFTRLELACLVDTPCGVVRACLDE